MRWLGKSGGSGEGEVIWELAESLPGGRGSSRCGELTTYVRFGVIARHRMVFAPVGPEYFP
jgi:hypothetical protein